MYYHTYWPRSRLTDIKIIVQLYLECVWQPVFENKKKAAADWFYESPRTQF